ncbi:MAG: hypothetical protein COA69_04390 [Robiginitomaculum sp.]|nr:MAG: hypothetical protein COA69_04390 [Robiginitomaculum sp.]
MSIDSTENEALLIAATGDIISKPAPEANRFDNCLSCGFETANNYCPNCGQRNDDLRRSLWSMGTDILGGFLSFESRMWKTWAALIFKPGKVAREYADGARTRYSAPVRTYLVVSIIFFSFMSISNTDFINFDLIADTPETSEKTTSKDTDSQVTASQQYRASPNTFSIDGKTVKINFLSRSPNLTDEDVESLAGLNEDIEELMNTNKDIESTVKDLIREAEETDQPIGISKAEDGNLTLNNDSVNLERSMKDVLLNPKKFNAILNIWIPRVMFSMVPFAMILGALFLRSSNAMLIDHLIHAIYLHSFLFIALFFTILMSWVLPGAFAFLTIVLWMMVYFTLSIKRMYGRGWIKTIWTASISGFLYSLLLFVILSVITIYAVGQFLHGN